VSDFPQVRTDRVFFLLVTTRKADEGRETKSRWAPHDNFPHIIIRASFRKIWIQVEFVSDKSDNVKIRIRNWRWTFSFFLGQIIWIRLNLGQNRIRTIKIWKIFCLNLKVEQKSITVSDFFESANYIWIEQIFANAN